jgi:putative Mg2+ transporter-C (MgtC) family protein
MPARRASQSGIRNDHAIAGRMPSRHDESLSRIQEHIMDTLLEIRPLADILLAMALGGAIGFEREIKDRPAGFRTHMLVAGAAALLVSVGRALIDDPHFAESVVNIDPLRLAEAVIAGVSFIGAGTIFSRRGEDSIAGITTAASLLMVAILGVVVGFRFYLLASAATVLTLFVLLAQRHIERWLAPKKREE